VWPRTAPRSSKQVLVAYAVLIGVICAACDPDFFRVTSDSNPDVQEAVLPRATATTGAGRTMLTETSGDMGQLDYRLDEEKRAFLLDSSLEGTRAFFRGGDRFDRDVFPQTRQYVPLPMSNGNEMGFPVDSFDGRSPAPWRSVRLYDIGMCSSVLPLHVELQNDPLEDTSIAFRIVHEIFERIAENDDTVGPVQLHAWSVEPILRMLDDVDDPVSDATGLLVRDADALRVRMTVRAKKMGGGIGNAFVACSWPEVDIDFMLVLDVTRRVAVNNRECLPSSSLALHCPNGSNLSELELPQTIQTLLGSATLDENGRLCLDQQDAGCVQCFRIGEGPTIGSVRPQLARLDVSVSQWQTDDELLGNRCGSPAKRRISDNITNEIRRDLRDEVEKALTAEMLQSRVQLLDTPCEHDCDCIIVESGTERLLPGFRRACSGEEGVCELIIEADRVHLRPDHVSILPESGMLEVVVAEDEEDIQAFLLPDLDLGVGNLCDPTRFSTGTAPSVRQVTWPFGDQNGVVTLSTDDPDDDFEGAKDHDTRHRRDQGKQGRGPGLAAPPGEGDGLDTAPSPNGNGRGIDEAEAPGLDDDDACSSMCECFDSHDIANHDECMSGCAQFVRNTRRNERRAVCKELLLSVDLSECVDRCDTFGP
jgi:hypothetical protein